VRRHCGFLNATEKAAILGGKHEGTAGNRRHLMALDFPRMTGRIALYRAMR